MIVVKKSVQSVIFMDYARIVISQFINKKKWEFILMKNMLWISFMIKIDVNLDELDGIDEFDSFYDVELGVSWTSKYG